MEKKKLEIIRSELIKYISEHRFSSDLDLAERFVLMNNISKFLDPDNYSNNIKILDKSIKG